VRKIGFGLLFFSSVWLAGCSALKPIDLQLTNYALTQAATKRYTQQVQPITLLVAHPTAAPGYQSRYMLYTEQPQQLKAFTKNQWVAPPAKMLLPLLIESLTNSGYFSAVVGVPYGGRSDLRLETTLLQLEQSFVTNPSVVEMTLQVTLINARTRRVLQSKIIKTSLATSENSPRGGAAAVNVATQSLLDQVVTIAIDAASQLPSR
jgi:cholesterol transport system auxiliary component